jgi:hypothetical protein
MSAFSTSIPQASQIAVDATVFMDALTPPIKKIVPTSARVNATMTLLFMAAVSLNITLI